MKKIIINFLIYLFVPSILPLFITSNTNSKEYIILLFISYLLVALYFIFINKKELKTSIKALKLNKIKTLIIIFIIGFILNIISNYIINYIIIPNGISNNELANRKLLMNNKIIFSILLCIIIPFIEEVLFRLELKKIINNKYIYLFITSIIFSLLHNISDTRIIELLYIIPYFILGFTFASIYIKSDNIIYSIIAHMINNLIAVLVVII